MLIGSVFYYDANNQPLRSMDSDVSPGYAQRASADDPELTVKWECRNGDPRDVRIYRAGKRVNS